MTKEMVLVEFLAYEQIEAAIKPGVLLIGQVNRLFGRLPNWITNYVFRIRPNWPYQALELSLHFDVSVKDEGFYQYEKTGFKQ